MNMKQLYIYDDHNETIYEVISFLRVCTHSWRDIAFVLLEWDFTMVRILSIVLSTQNVAIAKNLFYQQQERKQM